MGPLRAGARAHTTFVFAGGGSLGAIEVGMLRALVAHGVRADSVAGSSVGAINAAFFAGGPDQDGVAALESVWRRIQRWDVFPMGAWRSLRVVLAGKGTLVDPASLRGLLESEIPYRRLLDSGPVVDALLASAALPAVFPPVVIGGRSLADGMLISHTPIHAAARRGATRIIVLPTGHACATSRLPSGTISSALHALNLLIARQLATDAEGVVGRVELVMVPPLCPLNVSAHDFSRTAELIDRAADATRGWLEGGGLESSGVPDSLRPHRHLLEGRPV